MKKQAFLYTFMLAALLLALAVPMTSAQDATATPAPTATPEISDIGSGSLQLQFWHGLTGGDGSTMQRMVEAFVEENPDISIHSEGTAWDTMYQKLQAAFVAGNPPDAFILHTDEIPYFASLGILRPSDDLFDTSGGPLVSSDFAQPAFDFTEYNGQRYGVLLDNHGFGTWVNLNAFDNAGVDRAEADQAPDSPEALLDLATRLTLDASGSHPGDAAFDLNNVAQWGMAIDWNRVTFQSLLKQFGGSIVSEDGATATVNSPEAIQALQFMYDLIYTHHVAPDPAATNSYNAFQAGTVAIMASGTWFRNVLVEQHPEIEFTVWPMWQAGPNPGTWVSAHVLFLSPTLEGDRLAAATTFIEWLSNHDTMWAESGQVPARISSQEALDPENFPSNIVFGQGFQNGGAFAPQIPNVTEVLGTLDQEINAAINNQKTVEQALNDANERMQAILDRGM
jgi:ABC-type glycerol-3-phosphate transport system substrate-binding protein